MQRGRDAVPPIRSRCTRDRDGEIQLKILHITRYTAKMYLLFKSGRDRGGPPLSWLSPALEIRAHNSSRARAFFYSRLNASARLSTRTHAHTHAAETHYACSRVLSPPVMYTRKRVHVSRRVKLRERINSLDDARSSSFDIALIDERPVPSSTIFNPSR